MITQIYIFLPYISVLLSSRKFLTKNGILFRFFSDRETEIKYERIGVYTMNPYQYFYIDSIRDKLVQKKYVLVYEEKLSLTFCGSFQI